MLDQSKSVLLSHPYINRYTQRQFRSVQQAIHFQLFVGIYFTSSESVLVRIMLTQRNVSTTIWKVRRDGI